MSRHFCHLADEHLLDELSFRNKYRREVRDLRTPSAPTYPRGSSPEEAYRISRNDLGLIHLSETEHL
jgi:hypothetical protein